MEKEWMKLPRTCKEYRDGVDAFLKLAMKKANSRGQIPCPCVGCVNCILKTRNVIREHLICDGFLENYTLWTDHGESSSPPDDPVNHIDSPTVIEGMEDMVNDIFVNEMDNACYEAKKFFNYMSDANQVLYPECNETKLSFLIWLLNHKVTSKWSDKSVDELLSKLRSMYPGSEHLPAFYYEAKKMVVDLGFDYIKIDACPNDCMLYWKENIGLDACLICKESRWKKVEAALEDDIEAEIPCKGKKVAAKQLRHFPLIPRLKKLFMSRKTAESMRWHAEKRRKDGVLRHPADAQAWKHVDSIYPESSSDCRNVRLGLSTDGMDPYRFGSSNSIWPVVVVVYNLHPWLCMKQYHMIMPLLIPGPKSPGNDIDIYLRPLIEELKELFHGVKAYDAFKKEEFLMRGVLLWTISDFPAYAMLSGYSTKGKLACPCCQENTDHLSIRGKQCYLGHRRFLNDNHKYRSDKKNFNGKFEYRPAPKVPSGKDVFEKIKGIDITFGKTSKHTIPNDNTHNWKKKSIFFELPYWENLLVRHTLDVMHIEKNVCDNLIGTLLGLDGKTKDNLKSRLDLKDMQIRAELHPIDLGNGVYELPAACFTMSKEEKQSFLEVLQKLKVPDGYSSNISRCINVKERKIIGLKSHDCRVLLHQLLPIAIRGSLPKYVCLAIIDLCRFFRELSSTNFREEDFDRLNMNIVDILCRLEMIFPPSFFSIMVHLPIHLAEEAKIAGPVKFHQMYAFERYNYKVKGYIRCSSRPEGSIAEGVIAEECLTFCSRYLSEVDASWNRQGRNEDGYVQHSMAALPMFQQVGRFLGTPSSGTLGREDIEKAHRYILSNCEEVDRYRDIWKKVYMSRNARQKPKPRDIDNALKREFPKWFKSYVSDLGNKVSDELHALARGPNDAARRGNGYLVNGYRFHTQRVEQRRKTQNSGVFVSAVTRGYASSKDQNPMEDIVEYFGVLEEVIEVDYFCAGKVVLFKCKWYDTLSRNGIGVKIDSYGCTLVNPNRFIAKDDPFVMPSQVEQLFFVDDKRDEGWRVIVRTKPRDLCENAEADSDDDEDLPLRSDPCSSNVEVRDIDGGTWFRNDVLPELVDERPVKRRVDQKEKGETSRSKKRKVDVFINDDMLGDEEEAEEEEEEEQVEEEDANDDDVDDVDEDDYMDSD